MPHRIAKQIFKEIEQANKILLVPHQDPDGDALGSISSFSYFLKNINKPHSVYCLTEVSPKLKSLPHLLDVCTDTGIWKDDAYDMIIVLDSGDLKYAGIKKYIDGMTHDPIIINIDHHLSSSLLG